MRLFIACDLSEEASDTLRQAQKSLKSRFAEQTFPRSFHLTLKFLGEVQPDVVEKVKSALASLSFKRFRASLGSPGTFDSFGKPRVVWVGLEPKDIFHQLQSVVDDVLQGLFPREARFEPHVTLSRVKRVVDAVKFSQALKVLVVPRVAFDVSSVRLMRSTLTSGGPKYDVLFEQSFK